MPNIVTTRFQCLLKSDHQFLAARERIGGPPYPHVRIQSLPSDNQLIACGKNPYLYSFKKKKSRWGRICKPYKPAQESQVNFAQIYLGCSHQIFGRVTKYTTGPAWRCSSAPASSWSFCSEVISATLKKHGWSLKIWWYQ